MSIDGDYDTLTPLLRRRYLNSNRADGVQINESFSGQERAFAGLCSGDVDLVDATRAMTAPEWHDCQAHGLDVVQFTVASDAIVLATRSQTDVGSDCLSTDQVRAAFQDGSEISSWAQLGSDFDSVPFTAAGPTVESGVARYFDRTILGNPEPMNADFRVDYQPTRDEDSTRSFVTGMQRDRLVARSLQTVRPKYLRLKRQVKIAWQVWADADAEVTEAVAERAKGIRTGRAAATQAADERRVQAAYRSRGRAITAVNYAKAKFRIVSPRFRAANGAQNAPGRRHRPGRALQPGLLRDVRELLASVRDRCR